MWWRILLSFVVLSSIMVVILWRVQRRQPDTASLSDAERLAPAVITLLRRVGGDLPRSIRVY